MAIRSVRLPGLGGHSQIWWKRGQARGATLLYWPAFRTE